MKRPRTPPAAQEVRRPRPGRGPTAAWTLLLLGLLACGSGQGPRLGTLGAPPRRVSGPCLHNNPCLSLVPFRGGCSVVQEPALSVSPGGTVTLACALSSGSVTTYNEPSWYQQTPGQAPRNVIYNTNTRASGVPDRFSASISGNKATLTITGPSPRTRLTITACWTRAVVGTAAQWWEPMGKCYSAPPMCPEGQPLEAGEGGEGGSGQHPYGEGGSGSISCPWFTAPCLFQSLPGCVQVSKRTPQPIMMGSGAQVPILSRTLRLRDPQQPA